MIINMAGSGGSGYTYKAVRLTPAMTSATTPRGSVTASNISNAWRAWRDDSGTTGPDAGYTGWMQYLFPVEFTKVHVTRLHLQLNEDEPNLYHKSYKIESVGLNNEYKTLVDTTPCTQGQLAAGIDIELDAVCRGLKMTFVSATNWAHLRHCKIYGDVVVDRNYISKEDLNAGK